MNFQLSEGRAMPVCPQPPAQALEPGDAQEAAVWCWRKLVLAQLRPASSSESALFSRPQSAVPPWGQTPGMRASVWCLHE